MSEGCERSCMLTVYVPAGEEEGVGDVERESIKM